MDTQKIFNKVCRHLRVANDYGLKVPSCIDISRKR
jgi:hypothetical protein